METFMRTLSIRVIIAIFYYVMFILEKALLSNNSWTAVFHVIQLASLARTTTLIERLQAIIIAGHGAIRASTTVPLAFKVIDYAHDNLALTTIGTMLLLAILFVCLIATVEKKT